jgi:signal peptidase I
MEVKDVDSRYLYLLKVKRLCIFIFPLFFGFSLLQVVCNTSMPLAVTQGSSMQPLINEGDLLLFQGIPAEEIQVGDIIIFEVPLEMRDLLPPRITHRVTEIIRDNRGIHFRTKGDNAPPDTYEISSDKILGVNIAIFPYIGLFFLYIQTPIGIGLILAGGLVTRGNGDS